MDNVTIDYQSMMSMANFLENMSKKKRIIRIIVKRFQRID